MAEATLDEATPGTGTGGRARSLRRLLRDVNAVVGGGLVLAFLIVALLAPWISPHDPVQNDLANSMRPPGGEHLLGTDNLGRDILSRIIHGARISMLVGLIAVGVALAIGIPVGLAAGYLGGRFDTIAMRCIDILLAFPDLLLAILIMSILGPNLGNAMIAVGIASVPIYARLLRSSVLSVREEEFVEAARAAGVGHLRIMFRHILPNCLSPLIVQSTLRIGSAILTAATLSFLGLGAQPPTPEWGAMVSGGRDFLVSAPHLSLFPGLAILLCVLGFNLFGDALNDYLNPRLKA
ncbi:MAG TPA: nickel transporter permease [Bacillota bacterium]